MSEPFLAEIRLTAFGFPPRGWAQCNGQLLPINQNQALFSLLGTVYGGDGRVTFALPDLRGRVPVHEGAGLTLGQVGGEEAHTLTVGELPAHTHPVRAAAASDRTAPGQGRWAVTDAPHYGPTPQAVMADGLVGPTGGSQPHENMPPYAALQAVIALVGIFPSRD
ncbi:phage tail protein [Cellulomonas biazotea]|uniref:Tail Collar domain-containing protein n=1 Tax=Cellulomonas biazotea TaxID=1709 RepID=A0A402DTM2_9CELL|nr:tail fiber protein [Cellulomonas biazotea]GCE77452.1 tail Collar domain-containing protein [Cellulomonas biazotea]